MKGNRRFLGAVVVALIPVLALLVLIGMASAHVPEASDGPTEKGDWSALKNVDRFKGTLDKAGFALHEAEFAYFDFSRFELPEQALHHAG